MTIWKYPLEVADEQKIRVPAGARPLCVQVQRGVPCLWMHVDPDCGMVNHRVLCCGTGNPADVGTAKYVSTTQHHDGALVFHWFYE